MSEMRKRVADSHGEIRIESGAAVLGMLSVSQVPNDAESLKYKRHQAANWQHI
jgi:hypothetical protein